MNEIVKFVPPSVSVISYPDSGRYRGGFGIRSESSNKIYKICFDMAQMCFVCSCAGNISKGNCKHLKACNLPGRKLGRQIDIAKKYGWLT